MIFFMMLTFDGLQGLGIKPITHNLLTSGPAAVHLITMTKSWLP
jgi:hypothetical protein